MPKHSQDSEDDSYAAPLDQIVSTALPTYRAPIGTVVAPVDSRSKRLYEKLLYTYPCFVVESAAPPIHSHGMTQVSSVWEPTAAQRLGNMISHRGPIYGEGAMLTRYETENPVDYSDFDRRIVEVPALYDRLLDLDYEELFCSRFKSARDVHSITNKCREECQENCRMYAIELEGVMCHVMSELDKSISSAAQAPGALGLEHEPNKQTPGACDASRKLQSELWLMEKCLETHKTLRYLCGGTRDRYCSLHKWHLMRNALLKVRNHARAIGNRLRGGSAEGSE